MVVNNVEQYDPSHIGSEIRHLLITDAPLVYISLV